MQARDQAVDAGGDGLPVAEPVARKADRDVGVADTPLQ